MLVIPLFLGKNFVSLMRYALWEADCGQQALRAQSHLEEKLVHSREGKDGKVCKRKWPSNRKKPGLDQLQLLAYIIALTSHLMIEDPNRQI